MLGLANFCPKTRPWHDKPAQTGWNTDSDKPGQNYFLHPTALPFLHMDHSISTIDSTIPQAHPSVGKRTKA